MITTYSKPSGDIGKEMAELSRSEREAYERQIRLARYLAGYPVRKRCIVCAEPLTRADENRFLHRGIPFLLCPRCHHVQTEVEPPPEYPHGLEGREAAFHRIYPPLGRAAYLDRRRRIYEPKLEWILQSLEGLGTPRSEALRKRWIEIGSGSGAFLSALAEVGVTKLRGLEADEELNRQGAPFVPEGAAVHWSGTFAEGLAANPADIYCSFFVLEHLPDCVPVWEALRKLQKGTVFAFSVPVFGLSCLIENAGSHRYARNLDGVVHSALFTDRSIKEGMRSAGFEIAAEWIFGQDIADWERAMASGLTVNRGHPLARSMAKAIGDIGDAVQAIVDRARLSDQRHLLAVKT
jgi:hypothetical protein